MTSKAEPSPGYSDGGVPLARNLLSKGYALAGSGWASNGWAVSDGVKANTDLYEFFATTVGKPERVYAWGDSLGGLVTMETAEKNPDWVSGAAPLCGVVGGIVPNFDLAMDVQYGIRELIDPDFQLTGYESAKAASQQLSPPGARSSTRPPRRRNRPTSSPWPCSPTRSCRRSPRTAAPWTARSRPRPRLR